MAKLIAYVYVDGVLYGPDDDVPAAAAALITNPNAWEGGAVPAAPATAPAPAAPPRAGMGSGLDAWAAFAKAAGVDVAEDATRDDIIAACEQAGVIAADGQ